MSNQNLKPKSDGFDVVSKRHQADRNTVVRGKHSSDHGYHVQEQYSRAQVEHVANAVMVDTVGVLVDGVAPTSLPNKFTRLDGANCALPDDEWGNGALQSSIGRQSIRVRATKIKSKGAIGAKSEPLKRLCAEGSPAAHFQGHNIVSSGNVTAAVYTMLRAVDAKYGLTVPAARKLAIARGLDVEITRLDTAFLLRIPTGLSKGAVINGLALAGIVAGCDIGLYQQESVYFDQSSQSHSVKLYDKAAEHASKRKPALPESDRIVLLDQLMAETIRLEAVYRKKYFLSQSVFNSRPVHPAQLTPEFLAEMVLSELEQYNLRGKLHRRLNADELHAVPLPYRSTLAHWQNGMDIRRFFKTESALKQHRNYLKVRFSVDIFAPPPGEITLPVELGEILSPSNFQPVPDEIRNDPTLFCNADMEAIVRRLRPCVGSGISGAPVDPWRPDDEVIEIDDELRLI